MSVIALEGVSSDEEARDALSFGVPFGVPDGERPLGGTTVENEKLLKRKRLAKYADTASNAERTD